MPDEHLHDAQRISEGEAARELAEQEAKRTAELSAQQAEQARAEAAALVEAARVQAQRELNKLGPNDAHAVKPLLAVIDDKDEQIRQSALGALRQIGKTAVPALIEALKTKNEQVHLAAAEALKKIDPEAAKKAGIN